MSTKTHGLTKTPEFVTWQSMLDRCYNKNNIAYGRYAGKGITVCDRWRKSFVNFLEDMGPRPSIKHSIDRIDNNGIYEPGNCRWATMSEQNNNTSICIILTYNGQSMTISQWSEVTKITRKAIYSRFRNNWPISRILTTPNYKRR